MSNRLGLSTLQRSLEQNCRLPTQPFALVEVDDKDRCRHLPTIGQRDRQPAPAQGPVPRWWIERMQKLRCQPVARATCCSATGNSGFQIKEP